MTDLPSPPETSLYVDDLELPPWRRISAKADPRSRAGVGTAEFPKGKYFAARALLARRACVA